MNWATASDESSSSGPFYQNFTLFGSGPEVWQPVGAARRHSCCQQAAVTAQLMKHSDKEMPPHKSTRGAHGTQCQRKFEAITLQSRGRNLSCQSRHLPARGRQGGSANPAVDDPATAEEATEHQQTHQ